MFLIYNILFFIGFVLLSPYYLWRMRRRGGYAKDFGQRFGSYQSDVRKRLAKGGAIWIHSVSVGEAHAVTLVVQRLRKLYPDVTIVWSTTTSTGYAEIHKRALPGVVPLYYPLDFPWIISRALNLIRPCILILTESEIWPNMLRILSRKQVPVALINTRISPRSYRRYLKLGGFIRPTFGQLSAVAVQEPEDIDRIAALGVAREKIHVVGSLKFDAAISPGGTGVLACDPWELLAKMGVNRDYPILVGGSTWPGEEAALFDLLHELRNEFPNLFLVLVPRHAERTNEIVQEAKGKQVKVVLRTELETGRGTEAAPTFQPECLLVNTTGELQRFYETATVVFVGKSLFVATKSLQNPVEAAALGKPVIVGPNIESFEAIVRRFLAAGAMIQVRDVHELKVEVRKLLRDVSFREAIGAKAKQMVEENRGAVDRTVELLGRLLESQR